MLRTREPSAAIVPVRTLFAESSEKPSAGTASAVMSAVEPVSPAP